MSAATCPSCRRRLNLQSVRYFHRPFGPLCSLLFFSSLVWLSVAHSASPPTLVRSPYVQNVQTDHASILWTTREAGTADVAYSDGHVTRTVTAVPRAFLPADTHLSVAFYQYQADLTGLAGGTTYSYRVAVDGQTLFPTGAQTTPASFTTEGPGKFSFLVFGDSGAGTPEQSQLAALMTAEPGTSVVLHTGDLAYDSGTYDEFESRYFAIYASLMSRIPFFPTPGNHEYYTDRATPYLAVHALPDSGVPAADKGRYYSFDWSDAHFVSLDSNLLSTPSESRMLAWLDQDLGRTAKFWKIVYFHHTPYPSGHHLNDPVCARAREVINPIVERNGVQLVLNGHEHSYQRSLPLLSGTPVPSGSGTTYIITGGGGGPLQEINQLSTTALAQDVYHYLRADLDGPHMTIRAIGLGGVEIDRVVLAQKPQLADRPVLNAGDFTAGIAAGSLFSVFGQNLAVPSGTVSDPPLPTTLNGTTVIAGGESVPLLFVSPRQINAQLPFDLRGSIPIEVRTPNGSATATVVVSDVAPAILWLTSGTALLSAAHPVNPGDSITIYGTGFGPVTGQIQAGAPAPSARSTDPGAPGRCGHTTGVRRSCSGLCRIV